MAYTKGGVIDASEGLGGLGRAIKAFKVAWRGFEGGGF
jgi:hypothetical protein